MNAPLDCRPGQPTTLTLEGMLHPDRDGLVSSISKRGFQRIAYVEWGDPKSERVAVCVHGLSRQGRDFDVLASAMARQGWRVICPDLPGRGRSGWLRASQEYNLPQYAMDLTTVIAQLGVPSVDWIGTSLGGLIGMVRPGDHGSVSPRAFLQPEPLELLRYDPLPDAGAAWRRLRSAAAKHRKGHDPARSAGKPRRVPPVWPRTCPDGQASGRHSHQLARVN